ncbi:MAG: hypothetical protein E7658_01620 [Ruminococcaceae bacterium]|nr:hypothetical protein [Oscillospiraceae bacterium]
MEIYFLDRNFAVLNTPLDTMVSVVWSLRYYSCGTFTVVFPGCDSAVAEIASAAVYLCDRLHCGRIEYVSVTGDGIELRGRMLECLLSDRLLPRNVTYTGSLTDAVLEAVRDTAGDLPVDIDPEQPIMDTEAAFSGSREPLGEWLYEMLRPYGMSFSVTYDGTAQRGVFRLIRGIDRSFDGDGEAEKAVFSEEFGNIASLTFEKECGNVYNRIYIEGGDGTVVTAENIADGDDIREIYRKAADLKEADFADRDAYLAALSARGLQILREYTPLIRLDCTAEGDAQPRYGTGYGLGDICEIRSDVLGVRAHTQLTGLDIVYENGVEQLYPLFGDEIRDIRRLIDKLNK